MRMTRSQGLTIRMVTKYTAGMIVTLSLWGPRSSRVMLHRQQDMQDSQETGCMPTCIDTHNTACDRVVSQVSNVGMRTRSRRQLSTAAPTWEQQEPSHTLGPSRCESVGAFAQLASQCSAKPVCKPTVNRLSAKSVKKM